MLTRTRDHSGQNARGVNERGFRGGIVETGLKRRDRLHRREEDQIAATALFHHKAQIPCQQDRAHKIRFERRYHGFPVERFELHAGGIARENHRARERFAGMESRVEVGATHDWIGNVAGNQDDLLAKLAADGFMEGFGALAVCTIADNDARAFARQQGNGGSPEPTSAPGYDDCPAVQGSLGKIVAEGAVARGELLIPEAGRHSASSLTGKPHRGEHGKEAEISGTKAKPPSNPIRERLRVRPTIPLETV